MNLRNNEWFMVYLPIGLTFIMFSFVAYFFKSIPQIVFVCGIFFGSALNNLSGYIKSKVRK